MKSTKSKPIIVIFKPTPPITEGHREWLKHKLGVTDEQIDQDHMLKTHIDSINQLVDLVDAGEYVDVFLEDKQTAEFIQTFLPGAPIIGPLDEGDATD